MKFIHRLGYYLGGFSIGLIFLAFFLSGKRTSCDYGLDARVLKNINLKPLQYSDNILQMITSDVLDSTSVLLILKQGDVNFSASNTKLDSCKLYVVYKIIEGREISLTVENCDDIALVKSAVIQ